MEVSAANRLFNILSRFGDTLVLPEVNRLFPKDVVFFNQQVATFDGRKKYKNFLGNFEYLDAGNGKLVFNVSGSSNFPQFGYNMVAIDMHEVKNLCFIGLTTDEIEDDEKVWVKIDEIWRNSRTFCSNFPFPHSSIPAVSTVEKYIPEISKILNDAEEKHDEYVMFEDMVPGEMYFTLSTEEKKKTVNLYRACVHVDKKNPSPEFLALELLCSAEHYPDEGKISSRIRSTENILVYASLDTTAMIPFVLTA